MTATTPTQTCPLCHGKGTIQDMHHWSDGWGMVDRYCPLCDHTGQTPDLLQLAIAQKATAERLAGELRQLKTHVALYLATERDTLPWPPLQDAPRPSSYSATWRDWLEKAVAHLPRVETAPEPHDPAFEHGPASTVRCGGCRPAPAAPPPMAGGSDEAAAPTIAPTRTARYASTCPACRGPIAVGDPIAWAPGRRAQHTLCPLPPAPAPRPERTAEELPPGVSKAEAIETEIMEPYLAGDGLEYRAETVRAHAYRCDACGLVWEKRHQARDCAARGHVEHYEAGPYGVERVENGQPVGRNIRYYTRRALRREAVATDR